MKTRLVKVLYPVVVAALTFTAMPGFPIREAHAETETPAATTGQYEVASVDFDGNDTFSNSELQALIKTRDTPGFFAKTLHGWFESLGRPNEYFDPVQLGDDVDRLKEHYRNNGFQSATIDTVLDFRPNSATVHIVFRINEGYRSVIETIDYRGIIGVPEPAYDELESNKKIRQGDPFSKAVLEDEVKRVIQILNNEGYAKASFVRDSSWANYFTSTRNYRVVLRFEPNRRYRFGDIDFENEQDSTRKDIDRIDVFRQLDYEPENIFTQNSIRTSERNLNRTGIFDLARISAFLPPDTSESIYVPTRVRVRPKNKHELAPELSFSDENSNFNLGVGLGYSNRNFFGGARTATTRLRFRTATLDLFPDFFKLETDAIANLDLTFELLQPYVFTNKIKGSWSLSWIRDKQQIYISTILQNKFGFSIRFAEFTTGYLDWTQQLVQLRKRPNISINIRDARQLRQLRELEIQEREQQFNSIISFTIQRDMTNDIFSPSKGFIHALTIEESGVLPLLLNKWGWVDRPFTQFYRTNAIGRWYTDLTGSQRFSVLAMKLRAGFEEKYGASRGDTARAIPQTHRFYAGGGGSIRGWRQRDLSATGDPQLGGNLIVEGSLELRTNILQNLRDDFLDRLWTVLFIDAGNVWADVKDFQIRSTAIAAGFGIRYDTFFGPFRIDYGFRIYNPNGDQHGNRWITQRKFFGETWKEGVIHFGIGHAF